ncbi:MAG: hypothetical protein ACE10C_10760 [Candidatus Binatia bacterium]
MQLYRQVTANSVTLEKMPFQRELSMEAYLIENPELLALDTDELSTVNVLDQEIPMPDGRPSKGGDGRIDLIADYGGSTFGVIELKLGQLTNGHLEQLEDYMNNTGGLEDLVRQYSDLDEVKFVGVLVGTDISANLRETIEDGYTIKDGIPLAALTLSRYRGGDGNIYVITDTYFHNVSRQFDRTQYRFNGDVVGKGRLVLAVLKQHVENNPEITFSKLEQAFPKHLQGSYGCFYSVAEAEYIYASKDHKRHFLKPEELIELKDQRIAVCTEWGKGKNGTRGNIDAFIERAREHSYRIIEEKQ